MLVRLLTRGCVALLLATSALADEILVITGHETPFEEVTMKRLENIFLRKTLLSESGLRWIPLNLGPDHPVRLAFSDHLYKRSSKELESYWNEQYFQGVTPPYVVASEEAMLRFVTTTPGAIGYILPCHLDNRVQVVLRIKVDDPLEKYCKTPAH
jgi:hypothetical protein